MSHKDQVRVHVDEIADGYVVFTLDKHPPGVDTTKALNQCVRAWYQEVGPAIIWGSVPIEAHGPTCAIHVWYLL